MKAIAKRQKHIKVADRSDYGWATVQAYATDDLASGLDDEKRLEKAEKEAERQAAKKRKGASGNKRKASNWSDNPGPSSRREAPAGMMQPGKPSTGPVPQRPRVIGPCYRCAGWGHLAANCPKNKAQYPLSQSVVGLADQSISLHNVCMSSGDTATIAGSPEVSGKSEGINNSACSPVEAGKGKVVKSGHQGNGLVGMATKGVDVAKTNDSNPEGFEVDPLSNEYCENGDLEYELGITSKYWELESIDTHQVLDVQGRLKQNLVFWKETLQAPPPILDCIEYGYRLPLRFLPPTHEQSNHRAAMQHCVFVNEAVNKLVANRCAIEVNKKPYLCSLLLVVKNPSGKLRLVLNLKYLNQFLNKDSFKYEDLRIAALMFEQHDLLFKFDLKSGYHHVDIYPDHQKYLGFQWSINDSVGYYMFTVLPFGLSTACYLFTKLTRPLIRYWWGRGLKAIIYINDRIVAVKGKDNARRESQMVERDLESAGFVVNIEKSQWEPCESLEWLGFKIDLALGEFSVPSRKVEELHALLKSMPDCGVVPARRLASAIGKIMSMSLALGTVTRMMTRNLYAVLNKSVSWYQEVPPHKKHYKRSNFG